MQEYRRKRKEQEAASKATGVVLTLAVHLCAVLLVSFSGIKYLYPPPQNETFLLEFEQEEELQQPKPKRGRQPQAENVDKTKPVELIQRSQSPTVAKRQNVTPATKPDDFGDIEAPEPEREEEPKLDPRAAFPGMAKKDTSVTAPHSAQESSATFKAGQADGNTDNGNTEGKANAHLQGRMAKGTLGKPKYNIQQSGQVVVKIWVDQSGKVAKAQPGIEGTTISGSALWNICRQEALKARFNMSADAPALQEGTITYIFNLK